MEPPAQDEAPVVLPYENNIEISITEHWVWLAPCEVQPALSGGRSSVPSAHGRSRRSAMRRSLAATAFVDAERWFDWHHGNRIHLPPRELSPAFMAGQPPPWVRSLAGREQASHRSKSRPAPDGPVSG